jgi:hypothetical protein
MSELDEMLRKKRAELPQAYELTGTEAGTGTVTAPKDMTDKQAFAYDEAIRRQMDPARAEKSDEMMARIKAQAQEEHRKKLDKPRPPFFPQEDEKVEKGPDSKPLMGEPSEAPTPEALGVEEGRTGKEMTEDYLKYQGDGPDEFAGLGPDGQPRYVRRPTDDGIDEPPPRPIDIPEDGDGAVDTAMDIYRGAAKNYPKDAPIEEQQGFAVAASKHDYMNMGYNDEQPVAVAQVEYDGRNGEVREYADGDRFFVSFKDGVILRMRDRDSKSK